jgi:hypothetical protein
MKREGDQGQNTIIHSPQLMQEVHDDQSDDEMTQIH